MISFQCSEDDKFDLENYNGPFAFDAELEDGPVAVVRTLAQRLAHTCRPAPHDARGRYSWQTSYCVTVLWEDFGILDGMNAGNLEGLDTFMRKTSVSKIEPAQYRSEHLVHDTCDEVSSYDPRWVPQRRLGPGKGESDCGLCVLNWLERKALSWDENLRDPVTGKHIALKEYLDKVKSAGQRCESDEWEKVWDRVQKKYKEKEDSGKKEGKPTLGEIEGEVEVVEVFVKEGF